MNIYKRFFILLFLFSLVITVFSTVAIAGEVSEIEISNEDSFNTVWLEKISEVYGIFLVVATPVGACGIAVSGLKLFTGSEKDAEKAKKQIAWIAMTVAALYLLPAVISLGIDIGKRYGWNPRIS